MNWRCCLWHAWSDWRTVQLRRIRSPRGVPLAVLERTILEQRYCLRCGRQQSRGL